MPGVIATIGAAIEICKKLREASLKVRDAELKNLVGDLSLNLADLKMQLADMQEENVRLKAEISGNTQNADLRPRLTVRDGAYFLANPSPGHAEGPYCSRCFDVGGTLVLMQELPPIFKSVGKYKCSNCNAICGR